LDDDEEEPLKSIHTPGNKPSIYNNKKSKQNMLKKLSVKADKSVSYEI
jgi:hypothetical protein